MIAMTDDASSDRALDLIDHPALRDLVERRRAILGTDLPFAEMAQFIVVQPGDTIDDIQAEAGICMRPDADDNWPMWEWVMNHGYCFEIVFVLSDDGYGVIIFVATVSGIDPELIGMLHAFCSEQPS